MLRGGKVAGVGGGGWGDGGESSGEKPGWEEWGWGGECAERSLESWEKPREGRSWARLG